METQSIAFIYFFIFRFKLINMIKIKLTKSTFHEGKKVDESSRMTTD